jgi:hypothetical protein
MPCKNYNLKTLSHDYATVDEAMLSLCRAELCRVMLNHTLPRSALPRIAMPCLLLSDSCKNLDRTTVRRVHVTSACSAVTQQ